MSEKFKKILLDLLPDGKAWNKKEKSTLSKLALGISKEFQRIENRANDLLLESDPRSTVELIEDWERYLGLPDKCDQNNSYSIERRLRVVNRSFSFRGGQTPKYFLDFIKALGFESEIFEYREFKAGESCAGDMLSNGEDWARTWQLKVPVTLAYEFSAGISVAGEPLRVFRNDSVECSVNHLKPAHTRLLFTYNEEVESV